MPLIFWHLGHSGHHSRAPAGVVTSNILAVSTRLHNRQIAVDGSRGFTIGPCAGAGATLGSATDGRAITLATASKHAAARALAVWAIVHPRRRARRAAGANAAGRGSKI